MSEQTYPSRRNLLALTVPVASAHDIADRLSLWLSAAMGQHARQDEYRKHIKDWIAHQPAQEQAEPINRESIRYAVADSMTGLYNCGRVWSAWGVGTMSEGDFSPAGEDEEILDNITDAVISAIAADRAVPAISNELLWDAYLAMLQRVEFFGKDEALKAGQEVIGRANQEQGGSSAKPKLKGCPDCFGSGGKRVNGVGQCPFCSGSGKVPK